MKIEKKQTDNEMTLAIAGWLDTQAAPELEKELDGLPEGLTSLVFDCRELEYISSSGVRQVIQAYKKMQGSFKLINVSAEVRDVLDMTGITKRITVE